MTMSNPLNSSRKFLWSMPLALFLLACLLMTRGAVYAQPPSQPSPDDLAQRVVELTNIERRSAGLPPLKANAELAKAAKAHSLAMAENDFFSHENPITGSTAEERIRAAGYLNAMATGENIAMGQPTPNEVMVDWMHSPGHRANILHPDFREIGVGYVKGPGPSDACQNPPCQHYWTQDFGMRPDVFPVIINDEQARTDTPEVSLYIYGEGWAREMRLKNDDGTFSSWRPYAPEISWVLPDKEGMHTVTVELRNEQGDVRQAQDTIYLGANPTPTPQSGHTQLTPTPPSQPPNGDPIRLERSVQPDHLYAGDEVEVRFILTGNSLPCGEAHVRIPLDVVLTLDYSGSMGDPAAPDSDMSKLDAAKAAAKAFVQAVDLGTDYIAVVGFDDRAKVHQTLTANEGDIMQAIDDLHGGGGTNIADGILAAMDELTSKRHRKDAQSVIILLSDGQSAAVDAAQQAKAAGLRIVTIGLGQDVDADQLRLIASTPKDYYFAPDASQLESIFLSIAESIQQRPAAKNLTLTHRFDVTNFEIIPDSIQPQGEVVYDRVIWRVPTLGDEVVEFKYKARARVQGSFDMDLGDELTYLECGEQSQRLVLDPGLSVEVVQNPNITPTPLPTPPPEPLSTKDQTMRFLCGDFPWWLLLPLLLFLILLALILFTNFRGWREAWTTEKKCPLCCLLGNLLFIAYLFFLAGMLLKALQPVVCQPAAAIYFWQVTPNGDSRILYKPIDPDLPVREFKALNAQADCIACHSVALKKDVIAAIADGSNGPVTIMGLDGTLISSGDIQASYVAVSPDGTQVAYAKDGKDIYIYDIASQVSTPLQGASDPNVVETMPAWSPDGKTIAFVRAEGEPRGYALAVPTDIYTVPSQGGVATMLPGASGGGFNYYPAYSPDGQWLAFTRHTTGSSTRADPQAEIYLVPAQGGEAIRLQANDLAGGQHLAGVSNSWPTWSPDGRELAFNTKRNAGQFDIYITRIDPSGNSGPARPLEGAARLDRFEHLPQWGRPPRPNVLRSLLYLLPWLLGIPLLWFLKRWLCREKTYTHTLSLKREVNPQGGPKELETFRVRLTLEGIKAECERVRVRHPVDVLLVIDVSPSMGWKTGKIVGEEKLSAAQSAAKAFVAKMDPKQDRVGLISFHSEAQVEFPLEATGGNIDAAIDALTAGGEGTAIHRGLQVALEEMIAYRRADTPGVIVLLSDGGSEPVPAIEVAEQIKRQGFRLITIGFGQAADRKLLRQLATMPQDYHSSASGDQLEQVFLAIAEDLGDPISATHIEFRHQVNIQDFRLDEASIYPQPSGIEGGVIIWHLSDLMIPHTFRYQVVGITVGEQLPIDLGDRVTYVRCGQGPKMTYEEGPGLEVTVTEPPEPKEVVHVQKPPEPLEIPESHSVWDPDAVVLIGVGMFGRKVLTHVKKNLRDAAGSKGIPERVQFLLLDTAKYLASGKPLTFAGVSLAEEEVVVLDENLEPVIRQMITDPHSHEALRPWFVAEEFAGSAIQMKSLAAGTHGHRPLARAGLIRLILEESRTAGEPLPERLRRMVQQAHTPQHGVRVMLIGSLSEGMSGVLWDMAYLLREIVRLELGEAEEVALEAYLGIEIHGPNPNLPATEAELNAMSALRELTWLQLNPGFGHAFLAYERALNGQLQPLRSRLIDDLYLFPSKVKTDDVRQEGDTPALADFLTLRLDKENVRSWDVDWFEAVRNAVQIQERRTRMLHFGVGGSFAVRLPAYDLIEQVAVRWAREMIQGFLMGQRRESLEFSSKYMVDPALPLKPSALLAGFLSGFEESEKLYGEVPVPEALKALGMLWQGRMEDARELTRGQDASDAIQAYLAETIHLLLMGTDDPNNDQAPRAGKIAYTQEFLEALRFLCEGELRERIAKAATKEEVRQAWEQTRTTLLAHVVANLERIQTTKGYLGKVYAALNEHGRATNQWREQMTAVNQRFYLWDRLLTPDGRLLTQPEALADAWYEAAYAKAQPERHGHFLIWETTPQGEVDLQLLTEDGKVSSMEVDPEAFAMHMLAFARNRIHDLWEQATLAGFEGDALAALAEISQTPYRGVENTDWQRVAEALRDRALPASLKQKLFRDLSQHRRDVWAAARPRGEGLEKLTTALQERPPYTGITWTDLTLSDPLTWQLLHTLDVLTPANWYRYETIQQGYLHDKQTRTVYDWEFLARLFRDEVSPDIDMLLHPVVAIALRHRHRADLYGVALASGWVQVRGALGGIYPDGPSGPPLFTWNIQSDWDGHVYGLLYAVFRASDEAMAQLETLLRTRSHALFASHWRTIVKHPPRQDMNESADVFSLRVLSWQATRRWIRDMRGRGELSIGA